MVEGILTSIHTLILMSTRCVMQKPLHQLMNPLPRLRLLQLLNPALPVGSYSYSQGIEWACHNGWLVDVDSVRGWIVDGLNGPLIQQELPLLIRLFNAAVDNDHNRFNQWARVAHAYRDTQEIRLEDTHRARAIVRLLRAMPELEVPEAISAVMNRSALAAIAWPAAAWSINEQDLLTSFGFTWLDAQVTAAVKLVPLGQTDGQVLLHELSELFSKLHITALSIDDDDIGFSLPAQSMASMQHETQYSRLYRS